MCENSPNGQHWFAAMHFEGGKGWRMCAWCGSRKEPGLPVEQALEEYVGPDNGRAAE